MVCDDHMKLNVWYGFRAYQPLESVNINRLRKRVYEVSFEKRAETNTVTLEEVSSVDQIPQRLSSLVHLGMYGHHNYI